MTSMHANKNACMYVHLTFEDKMNFNLKKYVFGLIAPHFHYKYSYYIRYKTC